MSKSFLSKLDPTKYIADRIKQNLADRAEIKRMVDDMKPDIQRAYAEAYSLEKMKQAQEKAKVDAMPFADRMKLRMERANEKLKAQNALINGSRSL